MTILMRKVSLPAVSTNFSRTIADIIEMAHRHFGEVVYYNEDSRKLLQSIVLNLQSLGCFFWTTEEEVKSFSAPSEVLVDSVNYTCYLSHTAASDNKPGTGAYWTKYWYESGEDGIAWVTGTSYSSTGDFYPDGDTLNILHAKIRYNDTDYPLNLISELTYQDIASKQDTGMPTKLYFSDQLIPRIYLYPQPDKDNVGNYLLIYTREKKLTNPTGKSEIENDFRVTWFLPLVKLLAYHLAEQRPDFPLERLAWLKSRAEELVKNARASKKNMAIVREGI